MKASLMTLILSACALGMNAQDLKQQGTSVEQIVPEGWEHEEAQGDLNKDGIKDLVVLAKPNFKENMQTRDDGYEYNFNSSSSISDRQKVVSNSGSNTTRSSNPTTNTPAWTLTSKSPNAEP